MKRLFVFFASAVLVLSGARQASAGSFTVNFCPGDGSCHAGLTEASLTFTELLGTIDPNDYTLTLKIAGTGAFNVDQVEFFVSGVKSEISSSGYSSVSLTAAPGGVGAWTTSFDNINNGGPCDPTKTSGQGVCSNSTGLGPAITAAGLIWTYNLNLADGLGQLTTSNTATLRALFTDGTGAFSGPILSPGGSPLQGAGGGSGGAGGGAAVPEPASLMLLGSGLAFASARFRRKKK